MQYLHSLHILHWDLRPDNILLNDKFYPKLSDFGLAKQIHFNKDSMTLEFEVGLKGTVRYCAPEIFEDISYNPILFLEGNGTNLKRYMKLSKVVYQYNSIKKTFQILKKQEVKFITNFI